ncbi:RICIN domain-containing protein [Virgisporangium aliadipatigenens]|nr:RICIN domain-containing protein [Virgisporangium aliadipatigenens]
MPNTHTWAERRRKVLGLLSVTLLALTVLVTTANAAQAGPGPFYYIVAEHSGKVLMPENHSKDPGVRIVQMPRGGFGAQHWKVRHVENLSNGQTIRKFENRHSHLCITIVDHEPGLLTQDQCETGGWYREWTVSNWNDLWAERPVKIWSHESNLCMDMYGGWVDDYTPAAQYWCHSGPNQTFRVDYVEGT